MQERHRLQVVCRVFFVSAGEKKRAGQDSNLRPED